tara:strand:+ start:41 stop:244 length:204 start_codon:yes stop_codon:yes gene_type:complete
MKNIKKLHSVGAVIVIKGKNIGMTYAMYKNGSYDQDSGVHLNDINELWFYKLSSKDNIIVQDVLINL